MVASFIWSRDWLCVVNIILFSFIVYLYRKELSKSFCRHRFDYIDLWSRDETGDVRWPCWKCGRIFKAECGLDILRHGSVESKPKKGE
jgi:hypothetical protein